MLAHCSDLHLKQSPIRTWKQRRARIDGNMADPRTSWEILDNVRCTSHALLDGRRCQVRLSTGWQPLPHVFLILVVAPRFKYFPNTPVGHPLVCFWINN
jgi:hypothetical protein